MKCNDLAVITEIQRALDRDASAFMKEPYITNKLDGSDIDIDEFEKRLASLAMSVSHVKTLKRQRSLSSRSDILQ